MNRVRTNDRMQCACFIIFGCLMVTWCNEQVRSRLDQLFRKEKGVSGLLNFHRCYGDIITITTFKNNQRVQFSSVAAGFV